MKAFAVLLSGFFLFILTALGTAQAAAPDAGPGAKRVALVIGNSKYVHAVELPNPANDARLIASTLRNAGFEVIEGVDQDNAGMHSLISKFTEQSYDADLAVIFYAGHGMQVDGKNFLIPVDAELTSPAYLKTRTVQIDDFMAALPPDPAVGVIILDACRDNPLARTLAASLPKTRSLGSGLAPIEAKSEGVGTGGILIAYATDPGAIAFDGNGVNSPYSTALARHLTEPGIEIQSALTRVRGEVTETTQGRQRPWHNASLGREVFIGKPVVAAAPAAKPATDAAGAAAATAPALIIGEPPSWEVEQRLWDEASKRNTAPFYEAYLEQFPNGRFATVARLNIDALKDPKAQERAGRGARCRRSELRFRRAHLGRHFGRHEEGARHRGDGERDRSRSPGPHRPAIARRGAGQRAWPRRRQHRRQDPASDRRLARGERAASDHLPDARATGVSGHPDRSDDGGRACQA